MQNNLATCNICKGVILYSPDICTIYSCLCEDGVYCGTCLGKITECSFCKRPKENIRPNRQVMRMLENNNSLVQCDVLGCTSCLPWTDYTEHMKTHMLQMVREDSDALENAPEIFKKDRNVVLAAIKEDGNALQYAHENLRKDRVIVRAAVKRNGGALIHAHKDLRGNPDIVLAAIKQDATALKYAEENLRKNHDIVLAAIKEDWNVLKYATRKLKDDRVFILAAGKINGRVLEYASEELKNDREVVIATVNNNGCALKYAPKIFKKDCEIAMMAIEKNWDALEFVHGSMWLDETFRRSVYLMMDKEYSSSETLSSNGGAQSRKKRKVECIASLDDQSMTTVCNHGPNSQCGGRGSFKIQCSKCGCYIHCNKICKFC